MRVERAVVVLWSAAALLAVAAAARRADQDFEFAEDAVQTQGEPGSGHARRARRYIYDPHDPLCRALSCRRREVCVLRAAPRAPRASRAPRPGPRAALCADKRELLRRGDTLVAVAPATDLGARDDDDDVFYEGTARDDLAADTPPVADRCVGCGRSRRGGGAAQFVCGSDNRTYSSLCRLDLHNCVRRPRPAVVVACRGFCPCPIRPDHDHDRDHAGRDRDRDDEEWWRESESAHNEVVPPRRRSGAGCALEPLADRLLDWFSVLMDEAAGTPPSHGFPRDCKPEVRWMFAHLDADGDGSLTAHELYALRHDERERCLRPFLSQCAGGPGVGAGVASSRGGALSRGAWCACLRRARRPCTALAHAHPSPPAGAYVPSCDARGFYRPRQCHAALGVCWCVTPHGAERPGTRTRGKPTCPGEDPPSEEAAEAASSASEADEAALSEVRALDAEAGAPADDEDAAGSGGGAPGADSDELRF